MHATLDDKPLTIDSKAFQIRSREEVHLENWPTVIAPFFQSEVQYQDIRQSHLATLRERQCLAATSTKHAPWYASSRSRPLASRAVLVDSED